MEADGPAVTGGTDAEAPGFDVDAAVPEAGLGGGDGDIDGAGDVEGDPVVTSSSMSHIDRLAVDGYGEGRGAHLRWDGRGLYAGGWKGGGGKHEKRNGKPTRNRQEVGPRRESGNGITLAPEAGEVVSLRWPGLVIGGKRYASQEKYAHLQKPGVYMARKRKRMTC